MSDLYGQEGGRMKKILSCLSCMLLLFSILTACSSDVETRELVWNENGYESLVQSAEFEEIKQLEGKILNLAYAQMATIDADIVIKAENIDYGSAYKFYLVDPLQLSENSIEQDLQKAEYIWRIPISIDNGTIVVSCLLGEWMDKNDKGLYTEEAYQKVINKEVSWKATTAFYYSNDLPTAIFDRLVPSNHGEIHKIIFGDCNKSRGLYGITVENGVPTKMVPIEGFTAIGTERITARMKSAGDFQDGQVYTYEDFAERMIRVEPLDDDVAIGGGGLTTNYSILDGFAVPTEGVVLLVIIAAFVLTTGGVLVYQKVKDKVR